MSHEATGVEAPNKGVIHFGWLGARAFASPSASDRRQGGSPPGSTVLRNPSVAVSRPALWSRRVARDYNPSSRNESGRRSPATTPQNSGSFAIPCCISFDALRLGLAAPNSVRQAGQVFTF